jgi:uncharacterized protein (TIGR03000 family)
MFRSRVYGFAGLVSLLLFACPALILSQEAEKPSKPPVKEEDKRVGRLKIFCAPDAELEIHGVKTKQTGEVRTFVSPPLEPGKTYFYTIKIITPESGRNVVRMCTAEVKAGEETVVELRPGKDNTSSQIIFVPTDEVIVETMLDMAKVAKTDVVYDLGCGDGRIVVLAAKKYGARGVGIDIDPVRVKEALENVKKNKVEKLVEIREGDALKVDDLSKATVVTLYMLPEFMEKLEPIAKKQLKPGTRIVAHDYPFPNWKPDKVNTIEGVHREHTLYLWEVKK